MPSSFSDRLHNIYQQSNIQARRQVVVDRKKGDCVGEQVPGTETKVTTGLVETLTSTAKTEDSDYRAGRDTNKYCQHRGQ